MLLISTLLAINNSHHVFIQNLLIDVRGRDWLEAKRAIIKIFNDMGKPQEIKADKGI